MKKLLLFFALAAISLTNVWAYDFSAVAPSGQTLYYNISGNNATVTPPGSSSSNPWSSYTMPTGSLTIPSAVTYNGRTYSVTSIGNSAFYNCSGLTSVTIGTSVTSIGEDAFCNCTSLTSVTIGTSVTSIGEDAFWNCTGLTSVTIPNSVTSIGNEAFYNCSGLTSVTIGTSVTSIGNSAFSYCSGLTRVDYTGTIAEWCGISFADSYSNPLRYGQHLYINNSEVTNLVIPNSVTSIGDYAFRNCTGLTSVTIPNSVTSIGNEAFYNCSGLTSVTIPNFVDTIHGGAFYQCNNLISVTFNADSCICMGYYEYDMIVIEYPVFGDCINLTQLIIGPNVKIIPRNAFSGCSGLTSVTIGNSVTRIESEAFYGCDHLSSITCKAVVPPTVIDVNAFEEVWKGLPLTVPNESVSQYQYAYGWREFTNIIGATMGIEEAKPEYEIVSTNGSIAISGAEGQILRICDIQGRTIVSGKAVDGKAYTMPSAGVYLIQVGNHKAQKVVVVR